MSATVASMMVKSEPVIVATKVEERNKSEMKGSDGRRDFDAILTIG